MTAGTLDPEVAQQILAEARAAAGEITTDAEALAFAADVTRRINRFRAQLWEPYPWQHPHLHPPDWISERNGQPAPAGVCDTRCYQLPRVPIPAQGAWLGYGGRGCVAGWTRIYLPDEDRHERIDVLAAAGRSVRVLALTDDGPVPHQTDGAPFLKGYAHTWTITTRSGARLTATDQHRLLTPQGWLPLALVRVGQPLGAGAPAHRRVGCECRSPSPADAPRSTGTAAGSHADCPTCRRCGGQRPRSRAAADLGSLPSPAGADGRIRGSQRPGGWVDGPGCSPPSRRDSHPARTGSGQAVLSLAGGRSLASPSPAAPPPHRDRAGRLSQHTTAPPLPASGAAVRRTSLGRHPYPQPTYWDEVTSVDYAGWLPFYDMTVPGPENYAAEGLWHHNTGKTEQAAREVNEHAEGPPCDPRLPGGHRIVIVAPTQPDAVDSCVTGPSGIQTINPDVKIVTTKEGTLVRWPNRSRARVVGGHSPDDVERLRAAGNTCLVWIEEAAAIRRLQEVLDISAFGLRVGASPHYIITTTPKNRPEMKEIRARATVITKGRTRDAHRLPPSVRKVWEDRFGGTTLGRQELDAEELQDVEGALWVADRPTLVDGKPNADDRPGIENTRVGVDDYGWRSHDPDAPLPHVRHLMQRVIVGVDPPGGQTEAGIVVNGAIGNHGYTLADLSIAAGPDTWARRAIQAVIDYGAIGLAVETTYGGDNITRVIESAAEGLRVVCPSIFRVPTKVGKKLRAEPVVALYQQGRWHHVGHFPLLESEQTTWVEGETAESPNRLDAHVHAATWLLISARSSTTGSAARQRIPGRRPG